MKKLTAFFLACLLSAAAFLTSCSESGSNTDTETVTNNTSTAAEDTAPAEEEAEKTVTDIVKEKYADTNLNGYEYKVLAPGPGVHFAYNKVGSNVNEVWAESTDGTPLNDAIFNRNAASEALINIKITPVFGDSIDNIRNQVKTEVAAGTTDYDAVLNRMDYIGAGAQEGLYLNLKNISTMDVTNSWWDKNIVDTFTLFNSKLYWISGDINVFDDFAVEVIFSNKSILEQNGLSMPYSDVIEGTWSIEKMYQLASACQYDVDGDGEIVVGKDIVGHAEVNDHIKHWIYAMGEKSCDIGPNGELEINVLTERHIKAIDTLFSYMVDKQMTYTAGSDQFIAGNILFIGEMLGTINSFRDMEDDFGVVPMPKMDETQENYGNYVSNGWTTAYAIPITVKDPEQTGTILEVICGLSTDTVRSALYDVLFAAKLVRDTESVEMLNIIFSTKSYDWAVDFSWGGNFANLYNGIYNSKNNNYVSKAEKSLKMITKMMDFVIEDFKNLEH